MRNFFSIISKYQKDKTQKELLLYAEPHAYNVVCLTKLITKGEIGKNTPFYAGSVSTMIINEYVNGTEIYDAKILYTEKESNNA